jgi:hypothetical protein
MINFFSTQNIGDTGSAVKFQGFMLVVEPSSGSIMVAQDDAVGENLGTLHLKPGDSMAAAMVQFSHRCPHSVESTSSIPKEEVEVRKTTRNCAASDG